MVKDLNGMDVDAFLAAIEEHFMIEKKDVFLTGRRKRSFGMFLEDEWYCLTAKKEIRAKMLWKDWMYLFYKITC